MTAGTHATADVAYAVTSNAPANFKAAVPSLVDQGGEVALSWTASDQATYTLAVTPSTGVTGLPTAPITVSSWTIHLPANTGNAPKIYTFTLTSTSPGGVTSATSSVAVTVKTSPTGTLQVKVTGLPAGITPSARVVSAAGVKTSVTGPVTLTGLPAGAYSAEIDPVTAGGLTYRGNADGTTVTVAGSDPQVLTLGYHQQALTLQPAPSTVAAGGSLVLKASVIDPQDTVTWSTTGGSFSTGTGLSTT